MLDGPRGGFLGLGNARAVKADALAFFLANVQRYGDAARFRIAHVVCFQFAHPAHHCEVLVEKQRSFQKPRRVRRVLAQWNGNGLVVNEGASWVRQRRLVHPAFKPQRLARYVGIVVARTAAMLEGWRGRSEVDVSADVSRLTLGVVAESLFGADVERHTERFAAEVARLNQGGMRELSAPVVLPMWAPTPAKRRMRAAVGYLHGVVEEMIAARRHGGEDRGDLLSALLLVKDEEGDGGVMSDRQARDEAVNLMLAGNETTATAMTWTLHLLSQHPEVQAAVRAEVTDVLGGRAPAPVDLPRLVTLERAFKEALRLYPPAYILPREAVEDVEIGGHAVPRGSPVALVIYATQRDARWFPEPDAFRPERFAREAELPRGAYLPFGLGPRACIGKGFATTEALAALAMIFQRHSFAPRAGAAPVRMAAQISLHPKDGVKLALSS